MSKQIFGLHDRVVVNSLKCVGASMCLLLCLLHAVDAQTSSFTYQGKLTDGGIAASGQYDLIFRLFDASIGGSQIGSDLMRDDVQVTSGIFTVNLDFGSSPFTSATGNFLEISVRPGASTGAYIPLSPLQPITSSPYAIQTIRALSAAMADDATNLGGFPANQYVQTNDRRLTDDRNPIAGSSNYIQNIPGIGQQTASFNITGGGTADIFNAGSQYNIGGNRVLSIGGFSNNNLFAGPNTGVSGVNNTFVGGIAGAANTTGQSDTFIGDRSGQANTTGTANTFVGAVSGGSTTQGTNNSFFGTSAGFSNTTGSFNTAIGDSAGFGSGNLQNATAVGAGAQVTQSNSLVLGSGANVGIGTSAPTERLHVVGNGSFTGNLTVNGTLNANLPSGSVNYIQNQNAVFQPGNFTINGTGTANILRAEVQYNIGGNRVLSVPGTSNTFTGISAGIANTGANNSFFGSQAGQANTSGTNNAFFGQSAGISNASASDNSFFGVIAGRFNSTGARNSFFGRGAGEFNQTGSDNAFLGFGSGQGNTDGSANVFLGVRAGASNTSGFNNTIIGANADVGSGLLSNAAAIGANAVVSQSDSMVLGSGARVGIGTSTPQQMLHVNGSSEVLSTGSGAGFKFRDRGSTSSGDDWVWYSNGGLARFFKAGSGDLLTVQPDPNIFQTKFSFTGRVQATVLYATGNANPIIISSPNLTCFAITVNNIGQLGTHVVTCP